MLRVCVCAALLTVLGAYAPATAEPLVERKVDCVYPGERLGAALEDFAAQLGFAFTPGEFEDSYELDELIWVHARGVSPETACVLIGASGGLHVKLDGEARRVTLAEAEGVAASAIVRAFKVEALCAQLVRYQKRYTTADAAVESLFRPTACAELRDAVAEILRLEGAPGSAIGKRLVYTRSAPELARIEELLKLLETPGESEALRQDREHRLKLNALKSEFREEEMPVSALLWQLFKDSEMPVYIDDGLLDSLDLEGDTTEAGLKREQTHYEALLALAREQGWLIDSRNGAMRLHDDVFEGAAGYRVFEVDELLQELEKEYAALKSAESAEGFQGDLRSEGGVLVIVDALAQQLENAGYSPLIRAYGSRIVVVAGVEVVDRAVEVLTAIGWKESK